VIRLAACLAGLAVAVALVFVAHAISGSDLCLWCKVLGR
jgi:hypothetical protein